MQLFTELYMKLDSTTRTTEKVRALQDYLEKAPPEDAAWAIFFLMGQRLQRAVNSNLLREWTAEVAGLPLWLIEECYHMVGDLGETMALVMPGGDQTLDMPLHILIEQHLAPLRTMPEAERREAVIRTWAMMDHPQRFLWNKLITGSFRVGVSKSLVVQALAKHFKTDQAVMAHRVMGTWEPTPEAMLALGQEEAQGTNPAQPYPFFLASPVPADLHEKEESHFYQAEWKWDGIRCQLIHRAGTCLLWSRGEDLLTERFPEVAEACSRLPEGTVLDGEIMAWQDDAPAPFQLLQTRITRKNLTAKILNQNPVIFMAYDLLETGGVDLREMALAERRAELEKLINNLPGEVPIRLSAVINHSHWDDLKTYRLQARQTRTEGLMLKRLDSPYRAGRVRGDWWKWKIDPYTVDAVLTYAQPGHGRRAGLFTDYTFGVWHGTELTTIAKAYSGLTDSEINELDAWIRKNTIDKFGPVRMVKPEMVFELAFEGLQVNARKKSGIAVRFPRIHRWRKDKPAAEADSLETLAALLESHNA